MATRHLKKLKQQLQKEEVVLADSVTDGSDEEVEDATSKTPFNPFDLLSDNEDAVCSWQGCVAACARGP